jgi:hypothetical protein
VVRSAQWHQGRAGQGGCGAHQDAVPAVLDLQQLEAAALGRHGDTHRAGVEAVLEHLLECTAWAVDYLARGDAVDHLLVELLDRLLRLLAWLSAGRRHSVKRAGAGRRSRAR